MPFRASALNTEQKMERSLLLQNVHRTESAPRSELAALSATIRRLLQREARTSPPPYGNLRTVELTCSRKPDSMVGMVESPEWSVERSTNHGVARDT